MELGGGNKNETLRLGVPPLWGKSPDAGPTGRYRRVLWAGEGGATWGSSS